VVGIVTAEDAHALTVRTATETLAIPREDVSEAALSEVSMMPEDQLNGFTEDQTRDLVAYLAGPAQVPMLADAGTMPYFFNGRDLALWDGDPKLWRVERGEIVGRSGGGLARNEFLASQLFVTDFRLTLEVKLTPDGGNSGVQFRSAPLHEGMKGPQAD